MTVTQAGHAGCGVPVRLGSGPAPRLGTRFWRSPYAVQVVRPGRGAVTLGLTFLSDSETPSTAHCLALRRHRAAWAVARVIAWPVCSRVIAWPVGSRVIAWPVSVGSRVIAWSVSVGSRVIAWPVSVDSRVIAWPVSRPVMAPPVMASTQACASRLASG